MQHLTQLGVLPFDNVLSAFLVLAMVNSTLRTSLSATWSGCSFASLLNVDFLFNGFFDHLSNQEVWPIWTKRWSEPTYWPYCCWKRKNVLMFHFSLSIRLVSCGFYAYIWGGEDVSFIQDMWQQRFTVSTVILKNVLYFWTIGWSVWRLQFWCCSCLIEYHQNMPHCWLTELIDRFWQNQQEVILNWQLAFFNVFLLCDLSVGLLGN